MGDELDADALSFLGGAISDPRAYIVKQLSDDVQRSYGLVLERWPVKITGEDARQIQVVLPFPTQPGRVGFAAFTNAITQFDDFLVEVLK
jgi:hypothetical protein